ncbi:hypothetical protein [Brevibacillus porteri]
MIDECEKEVIIGRFELDQDKEKISAKLCVSWVFRSSFPAKK